MRHQQVQVDYWTMIKTSLTYLALVGSVYVLFRMAYAIYMLPRVLRQSQEQLSERLVQLQSKLKEKEKARLLTEGNSEPKDTSAITEGDVEKEECVQEEEEPKKDL